MLSLFLIYITLSKSFHSPAQKAMPMTSLHLPPPIFSSSNPNPNKSFSSSHQPNKLLLRFKTSHRQSIQYLNALGISPPSPSSPETLAWIISIVDYLKSKGFTDHHFPRLAHTCPSIFSSSVDPYRNLAAVFAFLADDLAASSDQSRGLILRCPMLLTSAVDFQLRPTLDFFTSIGLQKLNSPTNLNAHLLATTVKKLRMKVEFLESLGFDYEEAAEICRRCPSVFGYSVENNLRPKVEYLVYEMRRPLEELKKFPQYFAFSLEGRISPRHLHLRRCGAHVSLQKMLVYSDDKFYSKWKQDHVIV